MTSNSLSRRQRIALTALRFVVAAVFVLAGSLKLIGVPMMISVFDHVGLGQWFRYATGAIEIGGAILLLTPRFVGTGAVLLFATATGAVLSHLILVPGPPVPAAVLAVLTGVIAWIYRMQTLALVGIGPSLRVPT